MTGGLLVWGPMFKQTGLSAIAATGLFVSAQPFLGHRKWGQTGKDILLLVAGAVIGIAPIYMADRQQFSPKPHLFLAFSPAALSASIWVLSTATSLELPSIVTAGSSTNEYGQ